ncbi:MAG: hypothetical protein ACRDKW_06580, partial [Actinomycetota bacterium]
MKGDFMSGEAFVLGIFALITILLSVIVWNVFATARARASAARDHRPCDELASEVRKLRSDVEQLRHAYE